MAGAKRNLTLSVPEDVYRRAREDAARQDKSLSAYMADLMRNGPAQSSADVSRHAMKQLVDLARASRHRLRNRKPLVTDKSELMKR